MGQTSPSGDDVDVCRQANEAALEKGLSFCETPTARVKTLSRLVGFDSDEIDADAVLELDPDDEDADLRKRVLARTEEILADGSTDQPLDAINQAWGDVGTDFSTPEPEEEPEDDEEEEGEPDEVVSSPHEPVREEDLEEIDADAVLDDDE